MSKLEKAVAWAEKIAADNAHGYEWGGWGPGYDCGHLVITAFRQAGYAVGGATYTGNMRPAFLSCGFTDVTSGVNLQTGSGLRRGDVLLNVQNHVALCVGFGKIVQAGRDYDGVPGDSSGREIAVGNYYNYPWNFVLRPPYEASEVAQERADTHVVQSGDTLSRIAERYRLSWMELAAWNGILYPYVIHPGQVLKLKGPEAKKTEPAAPSAKNYTVQSGDSLWLIAQRMYGSGSRYGLIANANGLKYPYIIRPGMVLTIPESK